MRTHLLPATLAVALGLAGAAFAATDTTGTIKSMDMAKHMLTLDDGTVYMLPKTFKDPGLKVGDKVTVSWVMKGKNHDASKVTIVK